MLREKDSTIKLGMVDGTEEQELLDKHKVKAVSTFHAGIECMCTLYFGYFVRLYNTPELKLIFCYNLFCIFPNLCISLSYKSPCIGPSSTSSENSNNGITSTVAVKKI